MRSAYHPTEQDEQLLEQATDHENQIILYNDDVNTFDWVIECLVSICQHDPMQAEQCSLIVHYNGKCAVKEGGFDQLRPICEALIDRGLSATIE